jgi:hypothetical protein
MSKEGTSATRTIFQEAAEQDDVFDEARSALRSFASRTAVLPASFYARLAELKTGAVAAGNQAVAGAAWCLENIGKAQNEYMRAWLSMSEDRFYAAWCAFEQCEITLHFLARHFDDSEDRYALKFLRDHVPRWQSLFPYKVFISPGLIKISARCSICGTKFLPRHSCDHRLGRLYDGEACFSIVDAAKLLEISLVTNPVQKYSVAFPEWRKFDYAAVHYVRSGLASPWHGWETEWSTRRKADPKYAATTRNSRCPCGSGRKFKRCHLNDPYHNAPHLEILFHEEVAVGFQSKLDDKPHYGIDDGGRPHS